MSKYFKVSEEFLSLKTWIYLNELFETPYENLPRWVYDENIVYYLYNIHNGKGYVGETVMSLISRWRGNLLMNHQSQIIDNPRVLYRALRKYPLSTFRLTIIGDGYGSKSDRKISEAYWINTLHTNVSEWGYNLTWGADDNSWLRESLIRLYPDTNGTPPQWTEAGLKKLRWLYPGTNGASPQFIEAGHLRMKELYPETNGMPTECLEKAHSHEVALRRMETDKANHGGKLAIHSDESQEKARLARIEYYGFGNGRLSDPEVNKRAHDTMIEYYGSRMGAAVSEEGRKKNYESQRRNHNGVLAFNTKEAYNKSLETKAEIYGDPYEPITRPETRLKANITRLFNGINYRIEVIKSRQLPINLDSYNAMTCNPTRHLSSLKYYIQYLIKDDRWTDDMSLIFKDYLQPKSD